MDFPIPSFLPPDQAEIKGAFQDDHGNIWCVINIANNWLYTPSSVWIDDTGDLIKVKVSVIENNPENLQAQRETSPAPENRLNFGERFLKSVKAPNELCSRKDDYGVVSFSLPRMSSNIQIVDS